MTAEITCVARRHMKPAAFVTYDAMLAAAKAGYARAKEEGEWPNGQRWKETDSLKFYGSEKTLGNMNNRNRQSESDALDCLEESGWIIPTFPGKQRRRSWDGNLQSNEYVVIEHDAFVAANPNSCPPPKYGREGELLQPGRAAPGLERTNVRRIPDDTSLLASLPDSLADSVAASIAARRISAGNPAQVTSAGNPVQVEPANAGNPAHTCAGNPVTSMRVELEELSPTVQPVCESVGRAEVSSKNPESGLDEESERERTPEEQKRFEQMEWRFTTAYFPEEFHGAVTSAAQRKEIIEHLHACGAHGLRDAMREWINNRELPIDGLRFDKFGAWLRKCGPYLKKQAEKWRQIKAKQEREW
jgi:hypothetical protein